MLGVSGKQLDDLLASMESYNVIRKRGDSYILRARGRRIVRYLSLYEFDPDKPSKTFEEPVSEHLRKRKFGVNKFYFPKELEVWKH